MTPEQLLAQLQAYLEAGSFADWQTSIAPNLQAQLEQAGAADEAAMVAGYLEHLASDIAADTYDDPSGAISNSVAAVAGNLDNMINPEPPE